MLAAKMQALVLNDYALLERKFFEVQVRLCKHFFINDFEKLGALRRVRAPALENPVFCAMGFYRSFKKIVQAGNRIFWILQALHALTFNS